MSRSTIYRRMNDMLTAIKASMRKIVDAVIPVKLTEASIRQYVGCRFEAISKMVSDITDTDVSNIPLQFVASIQNDAYSAPPVAAYTCIMQNPVLTGGRYLWKLNPQERIMFRADLLTSVALPRKTWPAFIDSILAHELFHTSDARRDSSVFTRLIQDEDYTSIREQYTEWRAEKAVCNAFYPGRASYAAVSALRNVVSIDNSRKFKLLENRWTATLEELEAL